MDDFEAADLHRGKSGENEAGIRSSDVVLAARECDCAGQHGRGGLNLRTPVQEMDQGCEPLPPLPEQGRLAAAVEERYWEDAAAALKVLSKMPDAAVSGARLMAQGRSDTNSSMPCRALSGGWTLAGVEMKKTVVLR
ncbi:hypothetical protein [Paraburkholderia solisilvae]|uniref:hypothetical protein n=1 Tax=Paraburkholderia solisilvae TaxID=624376 RepID=UPI0015814B9D|nr:hypothetical protein [Paraburkholderia solisilvae]